MLAWIVLDHTPGLRHIMICCYRVRLRTHAALDKQALDRAAFVIPRIAQGPTRSVNIGVGISTAVEQHARDFQLITLRRIPERSTPAQCRLLQLFEQYPF